MLRMVIAAAFRSKGKRAMSRSELNYVLSFDLKWFSHNKSKQVVELAEKQGLLLEKDGSLSPAFDIESIKIPVDFKPDLKRILSSSTFDEIVGKIAEKSGKNLSEVVATVNKKQEELGNLLSIEVVALLIAKQYGIDVSSYLDKIRHEVLG